MECWYSLCVCMHVCMYVCICMDTQVAEAQHMQDERWNAGIVFVCVCMYACLFVCMYMYGHISSGSETYAE